VLTRQTLRGTWATVLLPIAPDEAIDFGRLEYSISRRLRIAKPSAKEAIIIVAGLALRKRRKTIISDNIDSAAPTSSSSGTRR